MYSRLVTAAVLAVLTLAVPVRAHEGHDHGAPPPAATATAAPRAEAQSALFELVAVARGTSLEIHLDRFETNEPVIGATIEVETPAGPATATAEGEFYRLDAPWAAQAGSHDLIVTVTSGEEADFLTATLAIPEARAPVVAQAPGWLVGSALASEMREALSVDLKARLSRNDPALLAVGALGFALGLLVMAILRRRAVAAMAAAGVLVFLFGTSVALAHEGHDHGAPPPAAPAPLAGDPAGRDLAQRLPDGAVFVPKPTQRILALRTVVTAPADHRRSVEMPGRVIPDPNASGYVQASVAGRLSPPPGGFPRLGARVKAGDVLAYVASSIETIDQSDLAQRLSELDQAISIAEQRVRRAQTLVRSGAVAQTTLDETRIELEGLRDRRAAIDEVQVKPEALVAPVSGVIAAAGAVAGQMTRSDAVVFHIVDPTRLWVEALAYGSSGTFSTASAMGEGVKPLALRFEGSGLSDRSQALPVQFSVEGPAEGLRPGQMLTVLAQTEETQTGLALPRRSVLRGANGQDLVFLHVGAERFEPREVRVLPLDGERVLVAAGIEAGSRVVTEGAELLNQIR
ncbi:HlyD family efflux transporter periplasmic adaptor subunit [Aurantimonas sp. Leaf443]|uniref:efflux RND transporter periplasmic adaptor subunit n=1 Tax=Aurantimonas sp. Leaf443 TaxID=1736378 RepID=UPI0006F4D50E|nr:HlyD family efflux transporter periplasmic adaptor subunit [Aurantimonas sp. Leaf443]KQT84142.1 RND transporter [Aurantimonas sp. Leaf443]